MKWSIFIQVILLGLVLSACSGGKKKATSEEDKSLYSMEEGSEDDSELIADDEEEEDDELIAEDDGEEDQEEIELSSSQEEEQAAENVSEQVAEDSGQEEVVEEAPVVASSNTGSDVSDLSVYQVQSNHETLMLIAFKIYGDYHKWREIASLNRDMFDDRYIIKKGMMLKFRVPENEFSYSPEGEPYLIKRGDTLGKISEYAYDTYRRWKEIWNNNKPLIKNPNKIFAGFTLYYIPDEQDNSVAQDSDESQDREPTSL